MFTDMAMHDAVIHAALMHIDRATYAPHWTTAVQTDAAFESLRVVEAKPRNQTPHSRDRHVRD